MVTRSFSQRHQACRDPASVVAAGRTGVAEGICNQTWRNPDLDQAWSTFGPHAIGAERFRAVSSGLQRYIVRPGRRSHPGETSPGG
jgi:hypothetical protein